MNKHYIFEAENIYKSFCRGSKEVLKGISLDVISGECVGILGANGCGKSTLLSILAGLGKDYKGTIKTQTKVGYVPQECPLIEELSGLDNLKLWFCDSPLDMKKELEEGFLAMLGVEDFLDIQVKKMSGGMKKRLSIGGAMAGNPGLLLLDEPGASLDLMCKERIEVYLKYYREKGNSIIIATHEEREIAMCDRLFVLKNGMLEQINYDGNIHKLVGRLVD